MAIKEFKVKTNEDACYLEASARLIGQDLLVAIWGGEKSHIGAVAVGKSYEHPLDLTATGTSEPPPFSGHT